MAYEIVRLQMDSCGALTLPTSPFERKWDWDARCNDTVVNNVLSVNP
jgi:hypothetical protein